MIIRSSYEFSLAAYSKATNDEYVANPPAINPIMRIKTSTHLLTVQVSFHFS